MCSSRERRTERFGKDKKLAGLRGSRSARRGGSSAQHFPGGRWVCIVLGGHSVEEEKVPEPLRLSKNRRFHQKQALVSMGDVMGAAPRPNFEWEVDVAGAVRSVVGGRPRQPSIQGRNRAFSGSPGLR